ncbi:MAG TPA: ATP-binding protein [Chitinophagaceae bacterium]|nr:ATP-binding protein [Chitinophagaceae bacterium]
MRKVFAIFYFFFCSFAVTAQKQSESESLSQWNTLQQQPLNEVSFRKACDLMQQIAKTDFSKSYALFTGYLAKIKTTHNQRWAHILLMGWARAKESLNFFKDAESLFQQARENAASNPAYYRESLVGTLLLYLEWGKKDSLEKYIALSEKDCLAARDSEDLSFTYTFKAMSRLNNQDSMKYYLTKAIQLSGQLPDKNALFTAKYNYAVVYCQNNPLQEVRQLDSLLAIADDSSLNRFPPHLYNRTNFSFRNAKSSVYYNLMQVNLLLTDYDNAAKFAQLFYDAVITPNPRGVQAPYFNAEMSIVKSYQGQYDTARTYLDKSRQEFNVAENQIPYISYFIAAGLLKEHNKDYEGALQYFKTALQKGNTEGLYIMPPEIYYAHALILTGNLEKAGAVLDSLRSRLSLNHFNAAGYYYYKYEAELLKAKKDYPGYANVTDTFYHVKDSLVNINRYRAIEELQAKYQVKEEQEQVQQLQKEKAIRTANIQRERNFYISIILLSIVSILLLVFMIYYRQIRNRQKLALQQMRMKEMEEQHRMAEIKGVMEAEESERRKIADQLHDEVGSMLSLASLNVSSVLPEHVQETTDERKLQKVQQILASVSETVRNLSHQLTPMMIEQYGFKKSVEDISDTINLSGKLNLETVIVGFDNTKKYPVSFLNHIYRITQELLNNIIKHARASHALLELIEHQKGISLIMEDNGTGIGKTTTGKGHGIHSIQSKIAYLKGSMEINSKKEGGTLVVIEIPFEKM